MKNTILNDSQTNNSNRRVLSERFLEKNSVPVPESENDNTGVNYKNGTVILIMESLKF